MNYLTLNGKTNRNLNIWNDFDRIFDSFFDSVSNVPEMRTPVTNVRETGSGLEMTVELPGFSTKELDVKIENNLLTIKAEHQEEKKEKKEVVRKERQDVRFERSFVLPQDIEAEKVEAELKNGLLTLKLPKQERPAPLSVKVNGK